MRGRAGAGGQGHLLLEQRRTLSLHCIKTLSENTQQQQIFTFDISCDKSNLDSNIHSNVQTIADSNWLYIGIATEPRMLRESFTLRFTLEGNGPIVLHTE